MRWYIWYTLRASVRRRSPTSSTWPTACWTASTTQGSDARAPRYVGDRKAEGSNVAHAQAAKSPKARAPDKPASPAARATAARRGLSKASSTAPPAAPPASPSPMRRRAKARARRAASNAMPRNASTVPSPAGWARMSARASKSISSSETTSRPGPLWVAAAAAPNGGKRSSVVPERDGLQRARTPKGPIRYGCSPRRPAAATPAPIPTTTSSAASRRPRPLRGKRPSRRPSCHAMEIISHGVRVSALQECHTRPRAFPSPPEG